MISSLHHDRSIPESENDKRKPEIILTYNKTKAGVDVVDQMCKKYSTRCTTRRWPVVHFQNILDVGGVNTQTIFECNHPAWSSVRSKDRRRVFLKELARQLASQHMTRRLENKAGLHKAIISVLESYVGAGSSAAEASSSSQPSTSDTGRCNICKAEGRKSRNCNRTNVCCCKCNKHVCGRHGVKSIVCHNCM